MLSRDGVDRAGVTPLLQKSGKPNWLLYFSVADVDATIGARPQARRDDPDGPRGHPRRGTHLPVD